MTPQSAMADVIIPHLSQMAKLMFDAEGEIQPMCHYVRADGSDTLLVLPDTDKNTRAVFMRSLFKMENAVAYVFIGEAWTLHTASVEEGERLFRDGGLKDIPNRVEIVAFMAEDPFGALTASMEIIRRDNERPRLGELKIDARSRESRGRMVGLLPTNGRAQ